MVINQKTQLDSRLRGYFAGIGAGAKRHAGNWQVYAAVTGSAMAMATNASAQILHTGVGDIITAQLASVTVSNQHLQTEKNVFLTNGNGADLMGTVGVNKEPIGFQIGVRQDSGEALNGAAFVRELNTGAAVGFLHTTSGFVKKFSAGATIASKGGNFRGYYNLVGTQHISYGIPADPGWAAGQVGLLGLSFVSTGSQLTQ
jgi:hypothetical protein